MYTVLLTDDESHIRHGIRDFIDWAGLGVSRVLEASDGIEALEQIEKHNPDIVITDIKMPGMDGMELARRIQSMYPEIKTIILTGFPDFTYAQKAIQYNVVDFVLKPTNLDKLREAVQKATERLEAERNLTGRIKLLEETVRNSREAQINPGLPEHPKDNTINSVVALTQEYIGSHYHENLKLDQIAAHVHCNPSYLSRLYKKMTNETITDTITRLRIQKATELLATTDLKFYEIATSVGLEDAAYFSIVFKKHTGKTPKEYRASIFKA